MLNKWTVGLIRKYRDKRAEESESRANKELSYIKRLFAWAYEYEKVPINPGVGIKKLSIAPRQHYAEDCDYDYLQELGDWESVEMVRRYAHLSGEHLASYVDRVSALRVVESGPDGYEMATGNKKGLN